MYKSSSSEFAQQGRRRSGMNSALAIMAVTGVVAGGASAALATTVTSSNWSGYADVATSSSEAFTNVASEWTVPGITATSSLGSGSYSAFWVGLDGYNSSTVEQIGIGADVSRGLTQYYAWYEMYPSSAFEIPLTVNPGNAISAAVSYLGNNQYDLAIEDISTGKSFSTIQTSSKGQRSSAEWIAEAPSSSSSGGVLPLANFGSITFNDASATLNGVKGTISSFSNVAINLVSASGLDATPSTLTDGGSSFTIQTNAPVTTSRNPGGRGGNDYRGHGRFGPAGVVPEPPTLLMLGALGGLGLLGRRRGFFRGLAQACVE